MSHDNSYEEREVVIDRFESAKELNSFYKELTTEVREDSMYVIDLAKVAKKYQEWKEYLPDIEIFYAVKCNIDPVIVQFLDRLGCGWDCASPGEIEEVLNFTKKPEKIIYAHPCKAEKHLARAKKAGVKMVTFDSVEELEKLSVHYPEAECVLRLKTHDEKSVIQFSRKFGASEENWESIMQKAKEVNMKFIGASFHAGTGSYDTTTFDRAIEDCAKVFNLSKNYGFEPYLLDIGGGFPGDDDVVPSFKDFATAVKSAINKYFAAYLNNGTFRMIAEPGRYMVKQSHTLLTKIVGRNVWDEELLNAQMDKLALQEKEEGFEEKKDEEKKEDGKSSFYWPKYYIAESCALSFSNGIYESAKYHPKFLEAHEGEQVYPSMVLGNSCSPFDYINDDCKMPILKRNEWLIWESMGAYTVCIADGMQFNRNKLTKEFFYVWVKDSLFEGKKDQSFDEYLTNFVKC